MTKSTTDKETTSLTQTGPEPHNPVTSNALNGILQKRLKRAMKGNAVGKDLSHCLHNHPIITSITEFGKYTIVELMFMGRRFHGLSSLHSGDAPNALEGVGRAYSRALNQLLVKHRFGNMKRIRVLVKGMPMDIPREEFEALLRRSE